MLDDFAKKVPVDDAAAGQHASRQMLTSSIFRELDLFRSMNLVAKLQLKIPHVYVVGNENTGLPQAWHQRWPDRTLAIPILGPIRSFNQANAAAMVLARAVPAIGGWDGWAAAECGSPG
jgi:tRNA(Leu) C34 or U34 (ribose-2'-O)-methylase TrmL